jgi:hypothetical protein
MLKGYIAWTTPWITLGVEGFVNTIRNDTKATLIAGGADTIDTRQAVSLCTSMAPSFRKNSGGLPV